MVFSGMGQVCRGISNPVRESPRKCVSRFSDYFRAGREVDTRYHTDDRAGTSLDCPKFRGEVRVPGKSVNKTPFPPIPVSRTTFPLVRSEDTAPFAQYPQENAGQTVFLVRLWQITPVKTN